MLCKDSRRFCEEFTWFLDVRKISTKIPQHSARIPEDSARNSHDYLIFAKFLPGRWIQRFFKIPWNSSRWQRIPQDSTIIQKDSTLFYRIPTWNQLKSLKDGFQLTSWKTPKTQQSAYYFVANYIFQRILSWRHII